MCFHTDNSNNYHNYDFTIQTIPKKNYLLQKDKQQLEKAHQDLSQHYAKLQIDIVQKDLEIESLRKELASHQVNEEQRKKLQDELDEMVLKRKALAKRLSTLATL